MERAQLVALLLPKRFMICALNLLLIVLPGAGAAVGTYLPGIGVLIRYRPAPKSPGGPNNKSPFGPLSSPLSRISAGGASWTSTSQLPYPGTEPRTSTAMVQRLQVLCANCEANELNVG
jgi:hypothetical protein